jgi:LmbE family N-acetylglucosaminyl deacetylase
MGVWAHPDDETYLSAGLFAHAVDAGCRVVAVTATRGEGGSLDEDRWPPEKMGEVRQEELIRSLAVLGVSEHYWLNLPDVDMHTPLPDIGAMRVRLLMDKIKPDTVLTFGPDGMTGHEGHKSVSLWTSEAFSAVAPPGARLYHATQTPEFLAEWVPKLEPFNIFLPGTPPVTPREELGISFVLDEASLDRKIAAIQEHASQIEGLLEVFGESGLRGFMREESYRFVAAIEPSSATDAPGARRQA